MQKTPNPVESHIINPLFNFINQNWKKSKIFSLRPIDYINNRLEHFLMDIRMSKILKSSSESKCLKLAHFVIHFLKEGNPLRRLTRRWLRENNLHEKFSFLSKSLYIYDNWKNELNIALENFSHKKIVWKIVYGYDNYAVSIKGGYKNLNTGKNILGSPNDDGYTKITLSKNGNKEQIALHQLIALTFIPNPENHPVINHKDGNKLNNEVSNLEWVTHQKNTQEAVNMGLLKPTNYRPVRRICPKTGEIKDYNSIKEAHMDNEDIVSYTGIIDACAGRQKTSGKMIWKYIDQDIKVENNFEEQIDPENEKIEFKVINRFPNYLIYSNGRVYNKKTKQWKDPKPNKKGYIVVDLYGADERVTETNSNRNRNNYREKAPVHRLVAEHFIPNPFNLEEVNHKNKNRADNRLKNLEWISSKGNKRHASGKPVIQLDVNRKEIARFGSLAEAEEETGIKSKTISSCAHKGFKNQNKYYWEFVK